MMAYQYIQQNKKGWAVTFGALALLFQPFIKIALGRTIWNVVDVIVTVLLIVLWIKEKKRSSSIKGFSFLSFLDKTKKAHHRGVR